MDGGHLDLYVSWPLKYPHLRQPIPARPRTLADTSVLIKVHIISDILRYRET
jgi:hypothetical protein